VAERVRGWPLLVRASLSTALAYRGRVALNLVTSFFPFLLLAVWLTVVAGGGPPRGWDAPDFVAYYCAAAVLYHLSGQGVVWAWDHDLRSGDLSTRLLRPMHPFHQYAADDLAHRGVTLAIVLPALVAAALLLEVLDLGLTPARAALAVAATLLAYLVGLLMASLVSLVGFWSTQTTNLWMLWWGLGSFTSGWVAPVALMPGWIQQVAPWLPFWTTLGFPVELWTGRLGSGETLVGFATAAGWAALFAAAYVAAWPRAVRRYQAVAG
jgi:ABC-2 type transport system permease protein